MNRCRTCGDRYPDAGDGWGGECGNCADITYLAEEAAEEAAEARRAAYDEMSLSDLMALADEQDMFAYHASTKWLEDYYDPAKSALIDLLNWHQSLTDDEAESTVSV